MYRAQCPVHLPVTFTIAMQTLHRLRLPQPALTLCRSKAQPSRHRLQRAAKAQAAADISLKRLDCPHFEQCSGCTVDQVDRPPILEGARAFAARLGVPDFRFDVGTPHGWRCRARLAVRGSPDQPVIGLFRAGTHDAIDVPHCRRAV